jgi:5-methylcytosine-specific restriction endonuclease McrA
MPTGIYQRIKPSSRKGIKLSPLSLEHKRKIGMANKGKVRTEEQRKAYSEALKGNKNRLGDHKTEEERRRIGLSNSISQRGKKLSEITKKRIGDSERGRKNWGWKGGYQNTLMLNRKRRAMKNNIVGSHTLGDWELLKKQYGYKCPCCGRSEPNVILTEDHIVPITKGGSDFIDNIQPLCKSCNSKKHTKIIKFEGGL